MNSYSTKNSVKKGDIYNIDLKLQHFTITVQWSRYINATGKYPLIIIILYMV